MGLAAAVMVFAASARAGRRATGCGSAHAAGGLSESHGAAQCAGARARPSPRGSPPQGALRCVESTLRLAPPHLLTSYVLLPHHHCDRVGLLPNELNRLPHPRLVLRGRRAFVPRALRLQHKVVAAWEGEPRLQPVLAVHYLARATRRGADDRRRDEEGTARSAA